MTGSTAKTLVYFIITACIVSLLSGFSVSRVNAQDDDPMPTPASATNAQATPSDKSQTVGDIPSKGETVGTPNSGSQSLINPLDGKVSDIPDLLFKIIDVLLIFALPLIVLFIMYSGYLFVTAAGNTEKVSSAKNALLWAVVGGVIILSAKLIFEIIKETVKTLA